MTWQSVILVGSCFGFVSVVLDQTGVFERIRREINPPPPVEPKTADRAATFNEITELKSDIDKLKLALSVKEFKR